MADDARVPVDVLLDAFGVPATVTRPVPDDTPIETTVVWQTPLTGDAPSGQEFRRHEPGRILAVDRAVVPTLPKGTQIVAPLRLGDADVTWRVDATERTDEDLHVVVVVREPEF